MSDLLRAPVRLQTKRGESSVSGNRTERVHFLFWLRREGPEKFHLGLVSVVVFALGREIGVVLASHAPAMAAAFEGSPKKRRRSGSDGPGGSSREQVTVDKLEEIHRLRARTEVNFSGHVLAADETVHKRDTYVRGTCTQREVAGFIAADASCLVQVALWGEVAQKYFESLTTALNEAEDGVFLGSKSLPARSPP